MEQVRAAFKKWDEKAVAGSRKKLKFGFFTALLGPLAVLLLTVQILIFPAASVFSVALIGLELAALITALILGFTHIGPAADEWIQDRLRAEVLRREEYLAQARVGPYLTRPNLSTVVAERLMLIDNLRKDPVELVPLQDLGGKPWRDEAGGRRQIRDANRAGAARPVGMLEDLLEQPGDRAAGLV
jgi:hypothetical protein